MKMLNLIRSVLGALLMLLAFTPAQAQTGTAARPASAYSAAVATEWFFERPAALRKRLPRVHDLLARFYGRDT